MECYYDYHHFHTCLSFYTMHEITQKPSYKIAFDDPSCTTWTVFSSNSSLPLSVSLPPSFQPDHLFTGDVFQWDETSVSVTLVSSPIRECS